MSKRSVFKVNKRVREGVEGQRKVQLHVMRTQTERIAEMVGARVRELIQDEVAAELNRRGYPNQQDNRSVVEVIQDAGSPPDQEVDGVVEDTNIYPVCPDCLFYVKDCSCAYES